MGKIPAGVGCGIRDAGYGMRAPETGGARVAAPATSEEEGLVRMVTRLLLGAAAALAAGLLSASMVRSDPQAQALFNGKDLGGWHLRHEGHNGWKVESGELRNQPPSSDLISDEKFRDFKLRVRTGKRLDEMVPRSVATIGARASRLLGRRARAGGRGQPL